MSFFRHTIFLLLSTSFFCHTFASLTEYSCHPDQRDALLEFKNEFKIRNPHGFLDFYGFLMDITSYPKTNSWAASSDCCFWDGVTCNLGKVTGLDLSCSCLHGSFKPNSSLFRLRHLRNLNLAYNNFTASPIPAELDKLMGLETLDLSYSSLSGQIPTELLLLTKLVSLDLSSFPRSPSSSLFIENPVFLCILAKKLRSLRELDMRFINISSEIPYEFSNISSLRWLRFEGCNLFGEFPSSVLLIPNLQSINLNDNPNLRGSFPTFRVNNSMRILSFYNTSFSGTKPNSIRKLKHLTSLTHSYTNFAGEISFSLGNLNQLTFFDVGVNKLSGNFPSALLNLTKLRAIKLYSNQFTSFLPSNISQLSKLEYFDASHNYFTGAIPSSMFKISSLTNIRLYNNLSDLVGIENISFLPNLKWFYIGGNNFMVSPVGLNVFTPLKQLRALDLSGIPFSTAIITSDFPSHLLYLFLSSCNITEFPAFIKHQRNLKTVALSDNNIKGHVPGWLWKLPELSQVYLFGNSFNGSLEALCGSKITKVDISNNKLYGSIPRCLGAHMSSLSDLNLRKNSLKGSLPDIFMEATKLRSLEVSHNQLEGKLPTSLKNCSRLC